MHFTSLFFALAAACAVHAAPVSTNAVTITPSTLAKNLMSYYNAADNGVLPAPYAWWESAGMWATMTEYWHITGDSQYNSAVVQALTAQAGSAGNFMGPNTLGNDDQLWWGIAAMTAAEYNLPTTGPSWVSLATNVWNDVVARWDSSHCNGGLGWMIDPSAPGHNYNSAITNGLFFLLSARLARLTGSSTYQSWAMKSFAWSESINLVDKSNWAVYDGSNALLQCAFLDHDQWSYNTAVYMYGAAVMLEQSGDTAQWTPVVNGLLTALQATFAQDNILREECESAGTCTTDQLAFKAFAARWLAGTALLVPSTAATASAILQASANGAQASCQGGPGGDTCGIKWWSGSFDGAQGVGQQLAALEIVQGLMAYEQAPHRRAA